MEKGYIQVYTGNGKGKTTAAFGVALRAAGAGMKIFIAQFVKGMEYSELEAFKRFDDCVKIKQYGQGCFIIKKPTLQDKEKAQQGLKEVKQALSSGYYDIIILDEANIAVYYDLFTINELLEVIDSRDFSVEIIVTGRYAHEKLIDKADLVTEMREIKHYYTKGIEARTGIEK